MGDEGLDVPERVVDLCSPLLHTPGAGLRLCLDSASTAMRYEVKQIRPVGLLFASDAVKKNIQLI